MDVLPNLRLVKPAVTGKVSAIHYVKDAADAYSDGVVVFARSEP